jgi:hypothetical protein
VPVEDLGLVSLANPQQERQIKLGNLAVRYDHVDKLGIVQNPTWAEHAANLAANKASFQEIWPHLDYAEFMA